MRSEVVRPCIGWQVQYNCNTDFLCTQYGSLCGSSVLCRRPKSVITIIVMVIISYNLPKSIFVLLIIMLLKLLFIAIIDPLYLDCDASFHVFCGTCTTTNIVASFLTWTCQKRIYFSTLELELSGWSRSFFSDKLFEYYSMKFQPL